MFDVAPTQFQPLSSLAGGALIGLAALLLMALNGRIAGISGIVSRILPPVESGTDIKPQIAFVVGLLLAPVVLGAAGFDVIQAMGTNLQWLGIAGLLVGFGSVLGSGCTSGHGVCGISRLSPRSLVATCVFMASAAACVFVLRHVLGN